MTRLERHRGTRTETETSVVSIMPGNLAVPCSPPKACAHPAYTHTHTHTHTHIQIHAHCTVSPTNITSSVRARQKDDESIREDKIHAAVGGCAGVLRGLSLSLSLSFFLPPPPYFPLTAADTALRTTAPPAPRWLGRRTGTPWTVAPPRAQGRSPSATQGSRGL